jgi:hypothetical protein
MILIFKSDAAQLNGFGAMKHTKIRWNPATQEWFCQQCGRTSDHASEADAHTELEQYECSVPWVDISNTFLENPGNG